MCTTDACLQTEKYFSGNRFLSKFLSFPLQVGTCPFRGLGETRGEGKDKKGQDASLVVYGTV